MVRQGWKRTAAIGTASVAAALLGTGVLASSASAHTPVWSVDCSKVSVNLTAYSASNNNTVTIMAGSQDLLPTQSFSRQFHKVIELPSHSSELPVRLVVHASDGEQFSRDETKTAPVCPGQEKPSAPPPASTPPPSSPSEMPTEKPSEKPTEMPTSPAPASTSAAAVVPADSSSAPGKDLAETGSSSSTPIIAGVAGGVLVAGAALVFVTRRRSAARN